MNRIPVEAPATGTPGTGETLEFFDAALEIVPVNERFEAVPNQLVETFPQGVGPLPGAGDDPLVKG